MTQQYPPPPFQPPKPRSVTGTVLKVLGVLALVVLVGVIVLAFVSLAVVQLT